MSESVFHHPHHADGPSRPATFPPLATALDKLAWALGQCREKGLRRTRALELLIKEMLAVAGPVTLAGLANSDNLREQCDQATIYRLLMRLEERQIIRRLGLHERAKYFILLIPGEHHDYLICKDCGLIRDIDVHCPVAAIENEIMEKSGFRRIYHELEFFGVCPECDVKASKIGF